MIKKMIKKMSRTFSIAQLFDEDFDVVVQSHAPAGEEARQPPR